MSRMLPTLTRSMPIATRLLHMTACKVAAPLCIAAAKKMTAYFAFKITDRSVTKRVERLHEAMLKVSKDFAPYLVDPKQLYQPLMSFQLKEDEIDRANKLFDGQLQSDIDSMFPLGIKYTEFRVVDGEMKAICQKVDGIKNVKSALCDALDRHGFTFKNDLKENGVIVMNLQKAPKSLQHIGPLKMNANAHVNKLYLCRQTDPIAQYPTDWLIERRRSKNGPFEISTIGGAINGLDISYLPFKRRNSMAAKRAFVVRRYLNA